MKDILELVNLFKTELVKYLPYLLRIGTFLIVLSFVWFKTDSAMNGSYFETAFSKSAHQIKDGMAVLISEALVSQAFIALCIVILLVFCNRWINALLAKLFFSEKRKKEFVENIARSFENKVPDDHNERWNDSKFFEEWLSQSLRTLSYVFVIQELSLVVLVMGLVDRYSFFIFPIVWSMLSLATFMYKVNRLYPVEVIIAGFKGKNPEFH